MNIGKKSILVVEDEFITAADLIANLEQMGFIVPASADAGEEVLSLALEHMPDLILMDINLKGKMTGIEAADLIKNHLDIPVVFLTGQSDEATISKALESEPFGYVIKPFEERGLKTAIAMALYKHSIDQRVKASEMRYRKIAENSDNLIAILNADTSLDYINEPGSDLFGKKPDELLRHTLDELLSPDEYIMVEKAIQSVISSSTNWRNHIKLTLSEKVIWLDATIIPLTSDPAVPVQLLWIARDITDWIQIQQSMEKEGIVQIEKNMEQFQILNDQIRNPLTVIASLVSLDEGPNTDKVLDYIQVIDDLVTQLDKGWIESTKVRSFLLKHYRHGQDI
ncbi:MAG TPA: response regulator [Methanospirillum sp.]|nr:response regulator [Methanospirillum sp.]